MIGSVVTTKEQVIGWNDQYDVGDRVGELHVSEFTTASRFFHETVVLLGLMISCSTLGDTQRGNQK